jgi:phage tail-like protein
MNEPRRGWLLEQLPRPMTEDHFTRSFMGIFEDIAGSVRRRVAEMNAYLDPGFAPLEFTQWLGRWLALPLDSPMSEQRLRALVSTAGHLFVWRGTRKGLAGLLEAVTGGPVEIADGGGVFFKGERVPSDGRISITLSTSGGLRDDDLRTLIALEVPPHASVELRTQREEGADEEPPAPPDQPERTDEGSPEDDQ